MNILPKKRWHVRTKENIARVRKDEAEAAEKLKQENLRIENADREARLNLLKQKSKQNIKELGIPTKASVKNLDHINLFENLEQAVNTTNKDHQTEVRRTKEEYEKKIGYLTYLGQDTNEALKKKNWYEVTPEISRYTRPSSVRDTYEKLVLKDEDGKAKDKICYEKNGEIAWKSKQFLDPIYSFTCLNKERNNDSKAVKSSESIKSKKYIECTKKEKLHDKDMDKKFKKLQMLREARLRREKEERFKAEELLKGAANVTSDKIHIRQYVKPKYNSQFNPHLARQNYKS